MVVLGEKLDDGPADRSVGVLGIVSRVFFLRSRRVRPTLLSQRERLPRTKTARRKRTCSIRGPAQESYILCVSGFPAGCTSIRIAASLEYE
jgi:hypothetical protein